MKRFSAQRQAVYDAVASTVSHPTADWVYTAVRKQMPKISLGTVYRDLADLKADGKLIGFSDESGVEHFDARTEPHVHFRCLSCGSVFDVLEIEADDTGERIRELTGAEVYGSVALYFGKCKSCKNKSTEV